MTPRDWKWMIFWSWIREIDPKIWLPPRSTRRLYIFRDRRGTRILRNTPALLSILHDCLSRICDITMSEGSIWKICRIRYHDAYPHPDVRECWSEPQCRSTHMSDAPIRQLRWIIPHISPHSNGNPPQYFETRRIYEGREYFEYYLTEKTN